MRDPNTRAPIHPADCACPRCDPQLGLDRPATTAEIAVCGLIVAASFAIVAFAFN